MIELVITLLTTFGVIDVEPVQSTAAEVDERPELNEVECFVRCMHWCVWPEAPHA